MNTRSPPKITDIGFYIYVPKIVLNASATIDWRMNTSSDVRLLQCEVYIKQIPGLPRASIVRVTDGIRPITYGCIEV